MDHHRLKINNLWHKYAHAHPKDWSVKEINLDLVEGELIGLLGPSGCGKTSLLRLIAGFETPAKGSIFINNEIVARPDYLVPPEQRGIGMVFQDYALFPHLDAWANVVFGLKRGQSLDRAMWLLEILGLNDFRHRYPHELSGGQKQRLALARALAPGTSLVLLDEPFSNLDVDVRLKLRSEISSVLRSCNASGLFVTHDPQEALAICDRVAVMEKGLIHQCSSPKDLVEKPATSFVGRFVLQRNVLPVSLNEHLLLTPIGSIPNPQLSSLTPSELVIDDQSFVLERQNNGEAVVLGREFLGTHWQFRILINNHILRVWHSLSSPLNVGEKCCLSFKPGHTGLLFPGSFSCPLT